MGVVDATANQQLAAKYGIKGYPTIKLFPAGPKADPVDYQGPREADAIIEYALSTLDAAGGPVPINQLTNPESFDESCSGKGSAKLCVILFLPHILDSGAKGRNDYLSMFQDIAKTFRKMPFTFLWSEGTAQPELEQSLAINGNFPTVAVLSLEKNVFAVPKVSWNKKNIQSFLNGVLSGT